MATKLQPPTIPVLLLKTKSSPTDAYEELFRSSATTASNSGDSGNNDSIGFEPIFVPVLEHRFDDDGIALLRDRLVHRRITNNWLGATPETGENMSYGGLIFTSQRAVEGFAKVVADGEGDSSLSKDGQNSWPYLQDVPVYSVGPATTRALRAVHQEPPLQVSGEHTGNGEDLAYYIQDHYAEWERQEVMPEVAPGETEKPENQEKETLRPLLFLVGDKRRDIIPKILMGKSGRGDVTKPYIQVDEVVVYGTGVMPSFATDFQGVIKATQDRPMRWVVVFSPTGCDSMLAGLGLLDPETGSIKQPVKDQPRTDFVATIGPTTRAYLRDNFGFEPDVCADEPSPQGIMRGITHFMAMRQ